MTVYQGQQNIEVFFVNDMIRWYSDYDDSITRKPYWFQKAWSMFCSI